MGKGRFPIENRYYEGSNLNIFAPAARQLDDFPLKNPHYDALIVKIFTPAAQQFPTRLYFVTVQSLPVELYGTETAQTP